jgi:hypothetical protein
VTAAVGRRPEPRCSVRGRIAANASRYRCKSEIRRYRSVRAAQDGLPQRARRGSVAEAHIVIHLRVTALRLPGGELNKGMPDAWASGSVCAITEDVVRKATRDRLDLQEQQLAAFMADIWRGYLRTANTELIEHARQLRSLKYSSARSIMSMTRLSS